MMSWYTSLVFTFAVADAGALLLGGIAIAVLLLFGKDIDKLMQRCGPALGILIASNIGASLILGAAKWLLS